VAARIGDLAVTAHRVDHSAFDSVAYLIESEDQRVLYSGDLRLHGRKPWMARQLIAAVKRAPLNALLLEGTHVGAARRQPVTESELEEKAIRLLKSSRGLALAAYSPVNLDRLVTLYRAARRSGRVFVADLYTAFVMHLAAGQARVPVPGRGPGVRVFYPQRITARRGLSKIGKLFEHARIDREEILREPQKHLMQFRLAILDHDFEGTLPAESVLIYSYWSGYLKRPDWVQLLARLKRIGARVELIHTSGHIFVEDIPRFVNALAPQTVIPIHTFHARQFLGKIPNVSVLEDGQWYEVR